MQHTNKGSNLCPEDPASNHRDDSQKEHRKTCLRSASWLSENGVIVLPCDGKRPMCHWSQYQSAQMPFDVIGSLLGHAKDPGIGIVVGEVSQIVVLDVDDMSVIPLLQQMIPLATRKAVNWYPTNRGLHLWFKWSLDISDSTVVKREGVELLISKHFAVCPPRRSSKYFNGPLINPKYLPEVPHSLIDWIRTADTRISDAPACELAHWYWCENRQPLPEGSRNNTLFRVACYFLRRTDCDYHVIAELIDRAVKIDGLSPEEAMSCTDSAMKRIRAVEPSGRAAGDDLYRFADDTRSCCFSARAPVTGANG